jgi:hypothetical protein
MTYHRNDRPQLRTAVLIAAVVCTLAAVGADTVAAALAPGPADLHVAARTDTSIRIRWAGTAEHYGVWLDGRWIRRTPTRTATLAGLPCGSAHRVGVRAVSASGRSSIVTIAAATRPCDAVPPRLFGMLDAQPQYERADRRARAPAFMINVAWDRWEPEPGAFSASYAASIRREVAVYLNRGDVVSIDPGFQTPPAWVAELPHATLTDQNGAVAPLQPNYEFSAAVQSAVRTYIFNLVHALGRGVAEYRLGLGSSGEVMYPDPTESPATTWWIGSSQSDLPPGVGSNPMPGWVPGSDTWNAEPVTTEMASAWYDWYLGALEQAVINEGLAFRDAGFRGQLAILAAGMGATPPLLAARLDSRLDAADRDPYGTMNTGAVFQLTIPAIAARLSAPVIVDTTALGDGTGDSSADQACQPGDAAVDTSPGSTGMVGWSSSRWVSALAAKAGLLVEGENARFDSPLDTVFAELSSCRLSVFYWLNDSSLNGAGPVTLGQYAERIAADS